MLQDITFPSPIDPALLDENALPAFSLPESKSNESEVCSVSIIHSVPMFYL